MALNAPNRGFDPYKIGCIVDLPDFPGLTDVWPESFTFTFDEAYKSGFMDRPVQVVTRVIYGAPWKDGFAVIDAFRDLVENEKCLGVSGPFTTDNALSMLPYVDKLECPNISECGSQLYTSHWAFNLSSGGMGDEPALMAAWIRAQGFKKVVIIKDSPSQIGEEYCVYFRWAAEIEGFKIIWEEGVPPWDTDEAIQKGLERCRELQPDCIVHFGLGLLPPKLTRGLKKMGWFDIPRIMCTAFVSGSYNAETALGCEGWVGVDQFDERNPVLKRFRERYKAVKGKELPLNNSTSNAHDQALAWIHAIRRMRVPSRPALRDALETVRNVPASSGAPGTVVTFGYQDHRGYKGPFLILRKGDGKTSSLVPTPPIGGSQGMF